MRPVSRSGRGSSAAKSQPRCGAAVTRSVSFRTSLPPTSAVSGSTQPGRSRPGYATARLRLTLGATVSAIERRDGELHVISDRGRLSAPVVVLATGVAPRSELLTGQSFVTDGGESPSTPRCAPRFPDCWPPGTSRSAHNLTAGRALAVEHWGDALGQGEVAGAAAAGRSAVWDDGSGVLVDDRPAHPQVRGLGRRIRRVPAERSSLDDGVHRLVRAEQRDRRRAHP